MSPELIENGFLGLSLENITASQYFKPIRWYLEKTAAGHLAWLLFPIDVD